MNEKHEIIVDKTVNPTEYIYMVTELREGELLATQINPYKEYSKLTRQEFLELAYQKGILIWVAEKAEIPVDFPQIDGMIIKKLREPEPFEIL